MNEWKPVLVLAKRSLILLLVTVLLSVASVLGLGYLADSLTGRLAQTQVMAQAQQEQLTTQQTDLRNVQTHIKGYETLRVQGLLGEPDRAVWVEQLQSSYRNLGLPGDVLVELQAAKPLQNTGALPEGAVAAPAETLAHDLQFELRDSLEPDVLALIQDFRAQVKGRFRVNSCLWFDPKDTGLTAQCVLRFITIPLAPTPAAPGASP